MRKGIRKDRSVFLSRNPPTTLSDSQNLKLREESCTEFQRGRLLSFPSGGDNTKRCSVICKIPVRIGIPRMDVRKFLALTQVFYPVARFPLCVERIRSVEAIAGLLLIIHNLLHIHDDVHVCHRVPSTAKFSGFEVDREVCLSEARAELFVCFV